MGGGVRQRVATWWRELQDSLWFLPAVLTAASVVLALGLIALDRQVWPEAASSNNVLFGGGADGARGVLSAIAGSLITVTATVFSITMVVLQLASSQFTPRILRTFTGDRGVQFVLAVFIATFTYELIVLRSIRSADDEAPAFVPNVAVTVGIVLALVSIGVLIFFVHHVARTIQVSVIAHRAASETIGLVEERYPAGLGEPAVAGSDGEGNRDEDGEGERDLQGMDDERAWLPAALPAVVRSDGDGYVESLDEESLLEVARQGPLAIRVERQIGEFVLPGAILASVWPAEVLDDELDGRLRSAFILGLERTLRADIGFGIRQVTDIAIRALSPGINDPTTATICIDRIGSILVHFANREPPARIRTGGDGAVVVIPNLSFDQLVEAAFVQLRHYGAGDPIVAVHLVRTLGGIADLVPGHYRAPLVLQARRTLGAARRQLAEPADVARVEQAAAWASGYPLGAKFSTP
jgi:uncharacterized membrane protein